MQGREKSGGNTSPTDDGMERPHSPDLFSSTSLSQSPAEPCCFVLIIQRIAYAPYPIDALLEGGSDDLYKKYNEFPFHQGAFTSLHGARHEASFRVREIHEDGRYILQMPCTKEQLPQLVEAGLSKCIEKVYNASKLGIKGSNYEGEKNPNFDQVVVTQALATTESHESPTGS